MLQRLVPVLILAFSFGCDKGTQDETKANASQEKVPASQGQKIEAPAPSKQAPEPPAAAKGGQATRVGELEWQTDESKAMALSKKLNRPIFADFRADWCAPCVELEKQTFVDPAVIRVLKEQFVLLRVDATDPDEATEKLMLKYQAKQLPLLLVIEKGEIKTRIPEFVEPKDLLTRLAN